MAPTALTGAGNVTSANGGSVDVLTVSKPANLADGDLLIAAVYHRTSAETLSAPAGWSWAKQESGNGTFGIAYKAITDAAGEASSYDFSTSDGAGRMVAGVIRVTGADLADPIDATGSSAAITGTSSITLPAVTAATAGCLLVSLTIDNGGATVASFTQDAAMSGVTQLAIDTGDSTSNIQVAQQSLTSSGSTGTRTSTMSPAANNSGGFMITIASGSESHSGTASITGGLTMSASGTPAFTGSASIGGTLAMSGTGSPATSGTAAFGGTLTMRARGKADTGIGLPVRGRPRWQLIAGPRGGGYELALSAALSRTYTARLTDNSELSFTLDTSLAQAAYLQPLATDVHVLFTGPDGVTTALDRLRCGQPNITLDADKGRVAWTCLDYRAVVARRILYSDATLTYSDVDQGEIAWDLIDYTQGLTGGNLGIAKGWTGTAPTGVLRSPTYAAGDSIGQRIGDMANLIGGFDWDISPTSPSSMRLDVWFPQRGSDRGVILEQGGLMQTATIDLDPSDYANALRYSGADGTDDAAGPTADELEAGGLGELPQGRWDAAFGDTSLNTQDMLDGRAAWQLGWSQVVRPVWTVVLKRGAWRGPSHIWLGDTVRVIAKRHGLDVDMSARVYEVAVTLSGDGDEQVQLTLNGPRQRYAWRARRIEQRLSSLERR